MNKINSKQTGNSIMSPRQTMAAGGLVAIWMCVVVVLWAIGFGTYIIILVMAVMGGAMAVVFFVCIMNKTNFDKIVTSCQYRLRHRRGETSVNLFIMPLKLLRKHIPIKRVHDDGIIEYDRKQYGVAIRYDPSAVPRSELEGFHTQMEYLANSFGTGIEASFHFYDMIDKANPLADTILRSINSDGKTLEQKKHLHGMYEEATHNDEPFVSTAFLLAIKLGKFKSRELAKVAYKSTVPGILKAMRERGIYAMQLVGENEIAIEFRQFAVMEKYQ